MSLEAAIAELNDNIKALTSAVKGARLATAETADAPAHKSSTKSAAKNAASTPAASQSTQPASSGGATKEQVQTLVLKLCKDKTKRQGAADVLAEFGATNVTTIKPADYDAVLKKLQAVDAGEGDESSLAG